MRINKKGKYTDEQRSEIILYFEKRLHSIEARQHKDRVKFALLRTVDYFEDQKVSWATIARWYIMAKFDRTSDVHAEFQKLKDQARLEAS